MSQCPNCEGYGIIEGRYCNCSLGQMAVRDALARGDHVAVAYNHQTGEKEVFRDMKHKPASAPSPEELARDIHAQVCEGLLSHDCEPEIEAVAALLRARGERWIPVSERLPDIEPDHEGFTRFVLVVCKHYTEAVKGRYIHKLKEWRVEGSNSNMNDSVTHWRPLPAPPREGE